MSGNEWKRSRQEGGGREGRADGSGSWNLRSMDCIRSECLGANDYGFTFGGGKLDENKNCEDGGKIRKSQRPFRTA